MKAQINKSEFYEVTGDRNPWLISLAEGWEWHRFSDNKVSTRWITDGTVWRCTNCGREFNSSRSLSGHQKEKLHD